ncbi:MAG: tRNA (N6-threonylcarbamoyladenosine(37)-N6)-methyltransferase TrmO [Succinivibrio sp.]
MTEAASVPVIGRVRSPYGEKFAVPRQPRLAMHARSEIRFFDPYGDPEAFRGLEGFSHIFVIFVFDRIPKGPFKATVRPPRLGGNEREGVFATRSPYRPSRLGLSAVRLDAIRRDEAGRAVLCISGGDFTDMTPVVDIKPYIPFSDSIPDAAGGFASSRPEELEVMYSQKAREDLAVLSEDEAAAVGEALAQDPRPAYKSDPGRVYGALLYGLNVRFRVDGGKVMVIDAMPRKGDPREDEE